MSLEEHLKKLYHLSDRDLEQTMQRFEPATVAVRSLFLEKGEVADRLGYLVSGLMRSFFYDDQANEITTVLFCFFRSLTYKT